MAGRSSALSSAKALRRLYTYSPRPMAARTTHEERTATERREVDIHAVTISKAEQILPKVRLIRLKPQTPTIEKDSLKARDVPMDANPH